MAMVAGRPPVERGLVDLGMFRADRLHEAPGVGPAQARVEPREEVREGMENTGGLVGGRGQ